MPVRRRAAKPEDVVAVFVDARDGEARKAQLQKSRAAEVGQKTLDMERQAIQAMMVNVTGQLPPGAMLPVVKSAVPLPCEFPPRGRGKRTRSKEQ